MLGVDGPVVRPQRALQLDSTRSVDHAIGAQVDRLRDRYADRGSRLAVDDQDHAARRAYDEDGATTIALSHLVGDGELVERLKTAYLEGWGRVMDPCRGLRTTA